MRSFFSRKAGSIGRARFSAGSLAALISIPGFVSLGAVSLLGCATYQEQLVRSHRAFDRNEHEHALGLLRDLEPDQNHFNEAERAQYAYLRGMSDYGLGYRVDARHWLAVAKAYEDRSPGILPEDWKRRTNEALDELNAIVLEEGFAALATSKRPGEDVSRTAPAPRKAARSDRSEEGMKSEK